MSKDEQRLTIAVKILRHLVANTKYSPQTLAFAAVDFADALMAECSKRDAEENEKQMEITKKLMDAIGFPTRARATALVRAAAQADRGGPWVRRTERGWGGYNYDRRCSFHRNTLLTTGEVRIVVWSFGRWTEKPESDCERLAPVKCYYETRACHAEPAPSLYFDEDKERPVHFTAPRFLDEIRDDKANDMHEAVVEEITRRMEAGEFDGGKAEKAKVG